MILDGRLAPTGNDDDVLNAGVDGLFDAVLDERLVHQRQHLLRLGLGGRQKACPQPRCGKDRLAHFRKHTYPVSFGSAEMRNQKKDLVTYTTSACPTRDLRWPGTCSKTLTSCRCRETSSWR